jgi:4-amino-4-deoxy-L-arabinose transferase-like glycosyltransferase
VKLSVVRRTGHSGKEIPLAISLSERTFRTKLEPTLLGLFGAVFVLQIVLAWRFPVDYDEGVYLQTLRAAADGFEPYRDIFLAQPPMLISEAMPFFQLFGENLFAARLAMIAFWAAGIAGIYAVGALGFSKRTGLFGAVFLALDPIFLNAGRTLQPEGPSLAFAIWAIAAGLYAMQQTSTRSRVAASALCGALVTMALATKFIAAPVLLPLLAIAVVSRAGWRDVVSAVAGSLVIAAVVLGGSLDALPALYDQTIRFHTVAGEMSGPGGRLGVVRTALEDPLVIAACVGVVAALRRFRENVVPLSWIAASVVLLGGLAPLFEHHLAVLAPPAALICAQFVQVLPTWTKRATAILVCALVATSAYQGVQAYGNENPYPRLVLTELERLTENEEYVVTDDPYLASLLDVRVPPELVDTSFVRVGTGYLTHHQVAAAMVRHDVRLMILTNGRLAHVPGLPARIKASCRPASGLLPGLVFSCGR